ncbi:hypothetical protein HDV03_004221 [Kappamyces sp. JEL0829]|nr:hypothetical protein HDV03_004221 [Kappamyces sp. JEL0829]
MKRSKRTSEEVYTLLKERAAIEEEYGKKLAKLAKNFTPLKEDKGTLLDSLDVLRNEMERSARTHLDLSQDLKAKLAVPLQDFIDSQAAVRKNHQRVMDKNVQLKSTQEQYVIKCRDRYEQKSQELASLDATIKSVGTSIPPKELEKTKAKAERVLMQLRQADQDYRGSADKLADICSTWRADFMACCVDYEKLEEDRYLFMRATLWKYANFLSDSCVLNDQSSERMRVSLEQCNFESDLQWFIHTFETGNDIPGTVAALTPEPLVYTPYGGAALEYKMQAASISDNASEVSRASLSHPAEAVRKSVTGIGHLFNFQKPASSGSASTIPKAASPPVAMERSFINADPNESSVMDATFLYDPFEVADKTTILFTGMPEALTKVRVLYDYKSQAREELDIRRDQLIPVTATHEDG